MDCPERIPIIVNYVLVDLVAIWSDLERQISGHENKENHSEGEEVGNHRLIDSLQQDLGSHVASCTNLLTADSASILALNRSSKTKVSNFQIEIIIEKDVFQFQIAMCHISGVHVVNSGD